VIRTDVAPRVFQRHGVCATGTAIFRKKLTRVQRLAFMSQHPACIVATEACATAHCWGCEIEKFGHTVRLIAPNYLKPFVKRQMNDVADAEAVVEAARWAQTMPGVGPITALAIETFAPDLNCFRRGRDLATRLELVPQQNATDGKPQLGKTSKMGQRDIRRLLISGAMAVLQAVERFGTPHARRRCISEQNDPWPLGYGDETRGLCCTNQLEGIHFSNPA
jgi:transposase